MASSSSRRGRNLALPKQLPALRARHVATREQRATSPLGEDTHFTSLHFTSPKAPLSRDCATCVLRSCTQQTHWGIKSSQAPIIVTDGKAVWFSGKS